MTRYKCCKCKRKFTAENAIWVDDWCEENGHDQFPLSPCCEFDVIED